MGRQREKLNAGDVVNNFEILEELQPMQQNGYTFHEYKGKCLRCGTISIKTRYHFSKDGCRHCFNKSDEDIGKVGQQDKSMTREQIERLNRAPYIMEGLLTLRNEIIMQAARDTRAKDKQLQEAAWQFFESEMFKNLCMDLDYELLIKEIKKSKRFRTRRP